MSFIETERLLIRTWMPSDTPAMESMLGDAQTVRFLSSWSFRGWSSERVRESMRRMTEAYERDGLGIWPVVLKEGGSLVGECGLQVLASGEVELGFLFDRAQWGHGYATEAARAVVDYGFTHRRLSGIVAFVHPLNARSIAILHRVGMIFDRVLRMRGCDLLRYERQR